MENSLLLKQKRSETRKKTVKVLTYVMLGAWALIVLFPFYWMILTSFKSYGSYNAESTPKLTAK